MKRSTAIHVTSFAIILMLAAQAAAQAPAPSSDPSKPGVVQADVVRLTATVEGVDQSNRTVTLKSAGGRSTTLKVDKAVKNLDQIKVGDKLAAEYIDAIAVYVRRAGTPPAVTETAAVELAPKGKKPAGIAVETTEITAAVENINYDQRLVTLRGPAGNARTLRVDPRVERLRDVKIGDELVIRHTEAVAIAVMKPTS